MEKTKLTLEQRSIIYSFCWTCAYQVLPRFSFETCGFFALSQEVPWMVLRCVWGCTKLLPPGALPDSHLLPKSQHRGSHSTSPPVPQLGSCVDLTTPPGSQRSTTVILASCFPVSLLSSVPGTEVSSSLSHIPGTQRAGIDRATIRDLFDASLLCPEHFQASLGLKITPNLVVTNDYGLRSSEWTPRPRSAIHPQVWTCHSWDSFFWGKYPYDGSNTLTVEPSK
ncbi:hypothetical protein NMY22_g9613 [Coprinellus aureogranulatus]|nr:hypothetical protein NMY22_g9613 [Coprinellus aureogranulatus]